MNETPGTVKTAAYILFVHAILLILGFCLLSSFLDFGSLGEVIEGARGRRGGELALLTLALYFVVYCMGPLFILMYSVLGVGLLQRRRWARVSAIIVSGIGAVLSIPIGTILGIIVIVLLNNPEAKAAFRHPPTTPTISAAG